LPLFFSRKVVLSQKYYFMVILTPMQIGEKKSATTFSGTDSSALRSSE